MKQPYPMAPGSVLDFAWDWTEWLAANDDTIASFDVEPAEPAVVTDELEVSGVISAIVALPGTATLGVSLDIPCRITTAKGRVDARVMRIVVSWRSD